MARVTVEDCVIRVPNRFELVMMAAQRARDITQGAPLTVDRDNDKSPVISLREIADETVSLEGLRNALIKGHQRMQEPDEPEEDLAELIAGETAWTRGVVAGEGADIASDGDPIEEEETMAGLEQEAVEDFDPGDAGLFPGDDLGPALDG
jgi:DNA-directed RNA polymerase subunit omega